jgi:hypothetical protein
MAAAGRFRAVPRVAAVQAAAAVASPAVRQAAAVRAAAAVVFPVSAASRSHNFQRPAPSVGITRWSNSRVKS